ncbi:MAG: DNA mismatch repair endonuclease MutL [Desulfovibrio sp.]|jgi:DNA mismatch repair protein MutL|nr:DNA mismatch repair endonuclease MutL [Desulfovibrio sp.]
METNLERRPIRLLPTVLQNQIAAGEVVDRPAGVLKELVENSLDAGATEIGVTLEEGGLSLVAVRDNGTGIPADELALAVTRYATSKVASFSELLNVTSYGFRGEALASIGSVADVLVESVFRPDFLSAEPVGMDERTDAVHGARIRVRHGEISPVSPAAIDRGTNIEVRDLFANIPARLKFLKSAPTELKRCRENLIRSALIRPNVGFTLKVSGTAGRGNELLRLPAGLSLEERLSLIWTVQLVENMVPFSGAHGELRVHGLMSLPRETQQKGDRILLYVNDRPVSNRILFQAVREAYKGRLTSREYPQVLLFLEINPQDVDVNVHPAKTEVRFREERLIFNNVLKILKASSAISQGARITVPDEWDSGNAGESYGRNAFDPSEGGGASYTKDGHDACAPKAQSLAPANARSVFPHEPDSGFGAGPSRPERPQGFWGSIDNFQVMDKGKAKPSFMPPEPTLDRKDTEFSEPRPAERSRDLEPSPSGHPQGFSELRSAKSVKDPEPGRAGYPVEVGDMVCLGQLANTYLIIMRQDSLLLVDQHAAHERVLINSLREDAQGYKSRPIMLEEKILLHPSERERFDAYAEQLASFGYDLETKGDVLYVKATPAILEFSAALDLLRDTLADRTDGMDDVLHLMACHAAVKAGQTLSADEAAGLLRLWVNTAESEFCPHGRPAVLEFTLADLEKLFKRKIA